MIELVKRYWQAGLSVIPVDDRKVPIGAWSPDQKEIRRTEGRFRGVERIGIVAGKVSGNLECIDVDMKQDRSGLLWKRLKKKIPPDILESTVIQTTVNGGYHIIYRCDGKEIPGNNVLARRHEGNKTPALIETRGEGGYFVAAPTKGYDLIQGDFANIPVLTGDQRRYILMAATALNEVKKTEKLQDDVFDRYNNEADIIALLEQHNWQVKSQRGDNVLLKRPGKTDSKWSASWSKSMRIFYCFTSSSQFDENQGYSPVGVYTLLEHAGNYSEAAKALREKYGITKQKKVSEQKDKPGDEIRDMLKSAKINLDEKLERPPTVISFSEMNGANFERTRVMTLGNFSTITGKSKSKKSFFVSMIAASALRGGEFQEKIYGSLPDDKKNILWFDTEQGQYDAQKGAMRVTAMAEQKTNFYPFCLRDFSYLDRCSAIGYALERAEGVGLLILDGIADLVYSINEESEATRVLELLMRWSKKSNIHIINVIHQNKADNFATGHLGSALIKKSEAVIKIEKARDRRYSHVDCDMMRGARDFESFAFRINKDGYPEIGRPPEHTNQDAILSEKQEVTF